MRRVIEKIVYDETHQLFGDLHLPENPEGARVVLLIHGGGWCALDRHSQDGVAFWLASQGVAVYNIEYRLTGQAPWPACGDDTLAAFRFLKDADLPAFAGLDRRQLFVVGASAGGHLALMTGLRVPGEEVAGIVSISGITELHEDAQRHPSRYVPFWGGRTPSEAEIAAASPVSHVRAGQPPVFLTHSGPDTVVAFCHAERFVEAARKVGCDVPLFPFDRPESEGHGIWIVGSDPHKLFPELEAAILGFLKR